MDKTVERIVINTDSIDIVSVTNGVNSVTQVSLEQSEQEVREIFERYNLSNITNYPFDTKIVRALADNREQLMTYLETCRQVNNSKKREEIPDSIPIITYDLRELKHSDLPMPQKLAMYRQARDTQNTFRRSKGKVELKMGTFDKAYFSIQEFLQNRNRKQTKELNAGPTEYRRNLRAELYNPDYEKKTNEISQEYASHKENTELQHEEEIIK